MGSGRGRGDRQARLRGTAVMPEPDCSNHLLLDTHFPLLSSYPPRAGMSRPGNECPRGGTRAPGDRRAPSSALLPKRGGEGGRAGRPKAARRKLSTSSVDDGFVLADLSSAHTRYIRLVPQLCRRSPEHAHTGPVHGRWNRGLPGDQLQGCPSRVGPRPRCGTIDWAGGIVFVGCASEDRRWHDLCREAAGGKSELHRAGCRVTPGRRLVTATESATESRPPMASARGLRQG